MQRHQACLLLAQPHMPLGQLMPSTALHAAAVATAAGATAQPAALQHGAQAGAGRHPAKGMPEHVSPAIVFAQPQAQQLAWQAGVQPAAAPAAAVAADGLLAAQGAAGLDGPNEVATYEMSNAGAGWDQPADQLLGGLPQPGASTAARQLPTVINLAEAAVEEPGPDSERVEQAPGAATACLEQLEAAALPAIQQRQAEGAALGGGSLSPPPKKSRKVPAARHLCQGVPQVGCNSSCRMHAMILQSCDPDSA